MEIETLESLPGSGKTEVVIREIVQNKDIYKKIVWIAPTIELIKATSNRFKKNGIDVTVFHSEQIDDESVYKRVIDFKSLNSDAYFIMITQAAYCTMLSSLTNNDILVIDEEIQMQSGFIRAKNNESISLIKDYISFSEYSGKENIGTLSLCKSLDEFDRDEFVYTGRVKTLLRHVSRKEETVIYLRKESEGVMFDYHILPNIEYIKQNKRVLYIGYNVSNSISFKLYEAISDIRFKRSDLEKNLRFTAYNAHANIYYLFKDYIGNMTLSTISGTDKDAIRELVNGTGICDNCLYVKQEKDNGLSSIDFNFTDSHKLPARPEGLNKHEWMDKTNIVLLGNYYLDTAIRSLFSKLDISMDQEMLRHIPTLVQQLTRSKIRTNCSDELNIIVISETTAIKLASIFKTSMTINLNINRDIKIKRQNGRPSKTDEDKKLRKKYSDRIRKLRSRTSLTREEKQEMARLTLILEKK